MSDLLSNLKIQQNKGKEKIVYFPLNLRTKNSQKMTGMKIPMMIMMMNPSQRKFQVIYQRMFLWREKRNKILLKKVIKKNTTI